VEGERFELCRLREGFEVAGMMMGFEEREAGMATVRKACLDGKLGQ